MNHRLACNSEMDGSTCHFRTPGTSHLALAERQDDIPPEESVLEVLPSAGRVLPPVPPLGGNIGGKARYLLEKGPEPGQYLLPPAYAPSNCHSLMCSYVNQSLVQHVTENSSGNHRRNSRVLCEEFLLLFL